MNESLQSRSASFYDSPLIVRQLLTTPIVDDPDQEIVSRDRRLTYRTFRERVARLANLLTSLGVKRGDTVGVMEWDTHRYLECFFAVPMIGAVLHTINVRLSPEQILYTIDHAEDDILLVHTDFLPILEQIRGRMDTVRGMILLSDEPVSHPLPEGCAGEYEELLAAAPSAFDFPDLDENSRATTFYTTGTTGLPKGVWFTHRQLVLHTLAVLATLGTVTGHGSFRQDDVYMPITPMFHVHAWGIPYVATMLGVKQVYPGRYTPEGILDLVEREGVTFSHCVPTILRMLLSHPRSREVDLSRWKLIIGGAAMSRSLCLDAMERGIDVFAGYGMSETCPILTISHLTPEMLRLPPEEQASLRCRTGRPLPLVQIRGVDTSGVEQPWDDRSPGEIVVRSPWLTQGYLKDHRGTERLWEGGWLHTGDVAVRDGRGYFRITDRMKDVIKVAGEWVSSLEIEDILSHHPSVAEVAVIPLADEKWGERPLALVIPRTGAEVTEKDLVRHLREYADRGMLTKHALLLKVRVVDGIDRTSVGKVNKGALRKRYGR